MNLHDILVILNYISVLVLFGCTAAVATHSESRMQKLALMVCVCLTCCSLGFLFRIEARTAEGLIIGQKLVYAFVTHGMFLMLLFILDYCGYKMIKGFRLLFHTLNLLISAVVLTLDHHPLFYKSYWAVDMGSYSVLKKDYGFFHTLAVGLFALYMALAVATALVFSLKNYRRRGYVFRLILAVAVPCVAYIIPKVFDWETDLQPFAFAIFSVLVLGMIYRYNLYDTDNIAAAYSIRSMSDALIVFGADNSYKGCNDRAKVLFPALSSAILDTRLSSELPELEAYLSGEKSEYTADDTIFDVSVRPIEGDAGRVLWFRDVTLERNYTRLLQSQVDTLYTYSYRDELTGAWNRRSYEETLTELRALPALPALTVAELDLNGLKTTNDALGHSAGDALLKGAAQVLTEVFAPEGQLFRTGGDEFFVLLRDCTLRREELERRLQSAMEHWQGPEGLKLSLSYGFSSTDEAEGISVDELMALADQAMYASKRRYYEQSGKDRRKR